MCDIFSNTAPAQPSVIVALCRAYFVSAVGPSYFVLFYIVFGSVVFENWIDIYKNLDLEFVPVILGSFH